MTETATPVVALQSASRSYRTAAVTVAALTDVSMEISSGELVGVAGPSGSGKTTLLNLVVGWDQPDSGVVSRNLGPGRGWTAMAVVPQELGLISELTAAQNVSLTRRLAGRDRTAPAELFARLGLIGLEGRLPDEMSVGEQQRTAVARALTCSPALLVADEPTAHQDEYHADQVMALLAERVERWGRVGGHPRRPDAGKSRSGAAPARREAGGVGFAIRLERPLLGCQRPSGHESHSGVESSDVGEEEADAWTRQRGTARPSSAMSESSGSSSSGSSRRNFQRNRHRSSSSRSTGRAGRGVPPWSWRSGFRLCG